MNDFVFFLKQLGATILAVIMMGVGLIFPVEQKDICMIAHRGYSGKYPENTALAFEKAGEHGSGGAETDIRRTKDGVYVTSHDSEVIYEDSTTLIIEENDYAQLIKKPLKNEKTGDKVYLTTFREYLEIMKKYGMVCFVELKGAFTDEQVREIFGLAQEVYELDKCILQSFDFDNLIKARQLFPDLPVMLTYGSGDSNYERCFEYGFSIDANLNQISKKMIDDFHERGLLVAAYTANNFMHLCYARSFDLDYLESDYYA